MVPSQAHWNVAPQPAESVQTGGSCTLLAMVAQSPEGAHVWQVGQLTVLQHRPSTQVGAVAPHTRQASSLQSPEVVVSQVAPLAFRSVQVLSEAQ